MNDRNHPHATEGGDLCLALLEIVREIVAELRARQGPPQAVTLDSSLDRDLGLDSLGRMELLSRVEKRLGVSLSESAFARVNTPRDLLRAVRERGGPARQDAPDGMPADAGDREAGAAPWDTATLPEVLDWHFGEHPDRTHVHLHGGDDRVEALTYARLRQDAGEVAAGLLGGGTAPGQAIAIMLPTSREYLAGFFGILLAGGVAVPLYPPARPSQLEDHVRRLEGILNNCRAAALITSDEVKPVARLLRSRVETLRTVATVDELTSGAHAAAGLPRARPEDLALLQYTSGSTGRPKGVELTHANLLTNIRAMASRLGAGPHDVMVSWLPLYHDMGLIGAWLGSLCQAVPAAILSPLAFLARPARWLRAIHRHGATLSAGPNFAYELCLKRIDDAEIEGVDLGRLRILFNGAEPVSPDTLERFCRRFERYGLRRGAMAPVYGLAECCVGLAFPPVGRGPVVDRVRRDSLERDGRAEPAGEGEASLLRFVACGQPIPDHEIRIVDEAGRELPERRVGRIEFRGPSCTRGYHRNPEETRRLFDGDWLESGDLGYLAEGDLYITGRSKDIVIRAGRNIHPAELEEAVGEIPGVRTGCVAAFGSPDSDSGTERLVVLAETREEDETRREEIRRRVREVVAERLDGPPDDVVLAPPGTVLKTSSGKIRRRATRRLYEQGEVGRARPGVRWQIVRLVVTSLPPALRRLRRRAGELAWASWAWTVFGLLTPVVWLGVMAVPGRSPRRRMLRAAFRVFRRLLGLPVTVDGLEHLRDDDRPRVLVANHASYVDGLVLAGVLPVDFGFVAKRELARGFLLRAVLRRLGTVFVERAPRGNAEDVRSAAVRAVAAGSSLLFFPEGTFDRMPGLLPFRMGAFVTAAEAGVPVVSVILRGTRDVLRAWSWLPRRLPVSVTVAEPVEPDASAPGDPWGQALRLRDDSRRRMLLHCGEPDLAPEGAPVRE